MSVLRKLWQPTIDKPKPSSGWGLIAVLLAAIAICASMCEYAAKDVENEELNQGGRP